MAIIERDEDGVITVWSLKLSSLSNFLNFRHNNIFPGTQHFWLQHGQSGLFQNISTCWFWCHDTFMCRLCILDRQNREIVGSSSHKLLGCFLPIFVRKLYFFKFGNLYWINGKIIFFLCSHICRYKYDKTKFELEKTMSMYKELNLRKGTAEDVRYKGLDDLPEDIKKKIKGDIDT